MFNWIKQVTAVFSTYWGEVLQDVDGFKSSKRLGFLISCGVVVGAFLANIFWHIIVDFHILNAALGLGGVAGAGIAGERFGKQSSGANVATPSGG